MVVVVAAADADTAVRFLGERGETVYRLGEICTREAGQEQTIIV
jgi:phosphoribosylaminoimidazole (AIR) synthetase